MIVLVLLNATKNNFLDGLKTLTICGKNVFIDKWQFGNNFAFMGPYIKDQATTFGLTVFIKVSFHFRWFK